MNQGTFTDPHTDPEMDPARQISGDAGQIKALQGPFKVHMDKFFYIDLWTIEKLKSPAWLEVNGHSVPEK